MSTRPLTAPRPEEAVLDGPRLARLWFAWVLRVTSILGGKEPSQLAEYAVASLPDAANWRGCTVAVSDEAGGYCHAISDGAIWRRSYDNAQVTT